MSTPHGPRGAIRGRGRGRARNDSNSRAISGDERTQEKGSRSSPNGRQANSSRSGASTLMPPLKQARPGNNQRRRVAGTKTDTQTGNGTSDAFQSSNLASPDQAWRDPTVEGNTTYQKRMGDLYQTV